MWKRDRDVNCTAHILHHGRQASGDFAADQIASTFKQVYVSLVRSISASACAAERHPHQAGLLLEADHFD